MASQIVTAEHSHQVSAAVSERELSEQKPVSKHMFIESQIQFKGIPIKQNLFVCFTQERDLRSTEQIKIKAKNFSGIAIRVNMIAEEVMKHLTLAIEQDAQELAQEHEQAFADHSRIVTRAALNLLARVQEKSKETVQKIELIMPPPPEGIVNLRFEDTWITSDAAHWFSKFLAGSSLLQSLGFQALTMECNHTDFFAICDGIRQSSLKSLVLENMCFDEEFYGKNLRQAIAESNLTSMEFKNCRFQHPKVFYETLGATLGEKCQLETLKFKAMKISKLEGKTLQYVVMKNQKLITLDISHSSGDFDSTFEFFMSKFGQTCSVENFQMREIGVDLSNCMDSFGKALAENTNLKILIMRENLIKEPAYLQFFQNIKPNQSLKKLNLIRTNLTDKVAEELSAFLRSPCNSITDLDVSQNFMTDKGLIDLCSGLIDNKRLTFLNLGNNLIKGNLPNLAKLLSKNTSLKELSLAANQIENTGIAFLSEFLKHNKTLTFLDISHNCFGDQGFEPFAAELQFNDGINMLDISKNKTLEDDKSMITLAKSLEFNKRLNTLDLSGNRIRRPFYKLHLAPVLQKNIGLRIVQGKVPQGVIDSELETNRIIQKEIWPNFVEQEVNDTSKINLKANSLQKGSSLNLSGKGGYLIKPAFKLISFFDVQYIDFSSMYLKDDDIIMLAGYIATNPKLVSAVLDNNLFGDDGFFELVEALNKNVFLMNLSLKNCSKITQKGFLELCKCISETNTTLFQIDLNDNNISNDLVLKIEEQTTFNRQLQVELKPVFHRSDKNGLVSIDDSAETLQTVTFCRDEQFSELVPVEFKTEVVYKEKAPVNKFFQSALKSFHILKPNSINLESQLLCDSHIRELCKFLADKNQVYTLNLRKNLFGNKGAQHLAELIQKHDDTLTSIDVTRNKIGVVGGLALLDAIKTHSKLTEVLIFFGNPIPSKLQRFFDEETVANRQMKRQAQISPPQKNKQGQIVKFEISDKGYGIIRSVIKTTQMLNILHLSLPDNLIALQEARTLSLMLTKNPPLKSLDLSRNLLDADCAALFAHALVFNSNLRMLTLFENKLGDTGACFLLDPLIRKQLQIFNPKLIEVTPIVDESKLSNLEKFKTKKGNFLVLRKAKIVTQLRLLDIKNNNTTPAILKHIQTLLSVNEQVCIIIDSHQQKNAPNEIQEASSSPTKQIQAQISAVKPTIPKLETNALLKCKTSSSSAAVQNEEGEPEEPQGFKKFLSCLCCFHRSKLYQTLLPPPPPAPIVLQQPSSPKESLNNKTKAANPFRTSDKEKPTKKKPIPPKQPDVRLPEKRSIFCWRWIESRASQTEFFSSDKFMFVFEQSSLQRLVAFGMIFTTLLHYGVCCWLLLDEHDSECKILDCSDTAQHFLVILAVIVWFAVFELAALIIFERKLDYPVLNVYLLCYAGAGLFSKLALMMLALSISHLQTDSKWFYLLALLLAGSQTLSVVKLSRKVFRNRFLLSPNTERNKDVAFFCGFSGLFLLYAKLSIYSQAQDESAALKEPFKKESNRIKKTIKRIREKVSRFFALVFQFDSPRFYNVILVDVPTTIMLVLEIALANEFVLIPLALIVILDLILNTVQLVTTSVVQVDQKAINRSIDVRVEQKLASIQGIFSVEAELDRIDREDEKTAREENELEVKITKSIVQNTLYHMVKDIEVEMGLNSSQNEEENAEDQVSLEKRAAAKDQFKGFKLKRPKLIDDTKESLV